MVVVWKVNVINVSMKVFVVLWIVKVVRIVCYFCVVYCEYVVCCICVGNCDVWDCWVFGDIFGIMNGDKGLVVYFFGWIVFVVVLGNGIVVFD